MSQKLRTLKGTALAGFPCVSWALIALLPALVFLTEEAQACSCASPEPPPFLSTGLLPANAKGVLFENSFRGARLVSKRSQLHIIPEVPKPLSASAFKVSSPGSEKQLSPKIVPLAMPEGYRPYRPQRVFVFSDAEEAACVDHRPRYARPARCEEIAALSFEFDEDWAEAQLQNGRLKEVTEEYKGRYGLFRIETEEGLRAGQRYTFSLELQESGVAAQQQARSGSTTIELDASRSIAEEDLQFVPSIESVAVEMLQIPEGISCSTNAAVEKVVFSFNPSDKLAPFSGAVQQFTLERGPAAERFYTWSYTPGLCSFNAFGKTGLEYGKELIYILCDDHRRIQKVDIAPMLEVKFSQGLLEVFDSLQESTTLELQFAAIPQQCQRLLRK